MCGCNFFSKKQTNTFLLLGVFFSIDMTSSVCTTIGESFPFWGGGGGGEREEEGIIRSISVLIKMFYSKRLRYNCSKLFDDCIYTKVHTIYTQTTRLKNM